jgi:hypothetical protein
MVGAHIPDMSSEVELFDVLYLGVFVILSTAYDDRLYNGEKPPPLLLKEATSAAGHFYSLLHRFSQRFIIVLEGEAVSISYVVDRMLAEFAAASVVFARAISDSEGYSSDDEDENGIRRSALLGRIENILQTSHAEVFPYFTRCLDSGHKDFLWTGPDIQILPRSEAIVSVIPLITRGELLDLPSHSIYIEDIDSSLPILPQDATQVRKRRCRGDGLDPEEDRGTKRSRKS